MRDRVSPGFAVAVKLNSADFQRGGFTEDDSRAVVAALAQEAVDLIEVSGGNYEAPAMAGSEPRSTRAREAYFLDYARSVRSEAGSPDRGDRWLPEPRRHGGRAGRRRLRRRRHRPPDGHHDRRRGRDPRGTRGRR